MSVYNAIKYDPINAGSLTLISTFTSDGSDATASFTSGIDSTYKEYLFIFNNIHPETDDTNFQVNFSIDSGSNYNVAKTTTYFRAIHNESDATALLEYEAANDLAQGTGFHTIIDDLGSDNDQACGGFLRLFNPSSTTFVKHFMTTVAVSQSADYAMNLFTAGYGNTTSAIDAVQFKQSSGEIQAGTIGLFGVK